MYHSIPFNFTTFAMPNIEEVNNIISSLHSGIFMGLNQDISQNNLNIFEDEIFKSVNQIFNTHIPKERKSPIKEIEIPLSFKECYVGGSKTITINRNINKIAETEILHIQIPKDVNNKDSQIVIEKGDLLPNYSICGDLKIIFTISKHSIFKKFGSDLILEKKILLSEALFGCSFNITLPNNTIIHIISDNIITPKTSKTINNLGFPKNNKNGDLHIIFNIIFPDTLEDKQKSLLYKLLPKRKIINSIHYKNNLKYKI